jgi:dipeptidyl aminopeptidase/acylaminoacyl peptidase
MEYVRPRGRFSLAHAEAGRVRTEGSGQSSKAASSLGTGLRILALPRPLVLRMEGSSDEGSAPCDALRSRLGPVRTPRRSPGEIRAVQTAIGRVIIAVALALAAAAPTAEATFPGRNGRIAFTNTEFFAEDPDYLSQVVSIRPDGSAPLRLAGAKAESPAYRPDGRMIAFARPTGIFLMRSDGSAERRLLPGPYAEPDWSPDGRRLVVTRTRKRPSLVIWDRGELRPLTTGSTPAWSPSGTLIAFLRADLPWRRGRTSIYVMSSEGCCVRRLGQGDFPEWSPDGRRVVFTRDDNLLRSMRPDGTGLRAVAPIHGVNPVYAPDGRRIAYVKNFQHDGFSADAILTMAADGRRRTRVFDTATDRYGGIFASDLDWQPRPPRAHR